MQRSGFADTKPHPNCYCYSYGNRDRYFYANSYSYSYGDRHRDTYRYSGACPCFRGFAHDPWRRSRHL